MRRTALLQTRVDPATAARARLRADRCGLSISEWIADVLRRELRHAGAGDALAPKAYELAIAVGYMLRTLMLASLGTEATDRAILEATDAAAEEAAAELARAAELTP
jgi:hypothetical protein